MALRSTTVSYEHDGAELEAYFAWDDASDAARPGILVSHAWGGRSPFEDRKADALAKLGYAGFALDLYGRGVRGSGPDENARLMQPFLDDRPMLQARLGRALDALRSQPQVDAARVAIMGYCFGGLCALDLARIGTDVRGAVSIHGLFNPPGNTTRIRARVLALHGWDDPMAQPDSVVALAEELTEAGADWQLHAYGNTMHAFTNPDADDAQGGVLYNADADRRSWQAIVGFLEEIF